MSGACNQPASLEVIQKLCEQLDCLVLKPASLEVIRKLFGQFDVLMLICSFLSTAQSVLFIGSCKLIKNQMPPADDVQRKKLFEEKVRDHFIQTLKSGIFTYVPEGHVNYEPAFAAEFAHGNTALVAQCQNLTFVNGAFTLPHITLFPYRNTELAQLTVILFQGFLLSLRRDLLARARITIRLNRIFPIEANGHTFAGYSRRDITYHLYPVEINWGGLLAEANHIVRLVDTERHALVNHLFETVVDQATYRALTNHVCQGIEPIQVELEQGPIIPRILSTRPGLL